jgi:hypothetical protein
MPIRYTSGEFFPGLAALLLTNCPPLCSTNTSANAPANQCTNQQPDSNPIGFTNTYAFASTVRFYST